MAKKDIVAQMIEKAKGLELEYISLEEKGDKITNKLLEEMEKCILDMENCYGLTVSEELDKQFSYYERCLRENLFMNGKIKYLV